jgi:hypothetical protein
VRPKRCSAIGSSGSAVWDDLADVAVLRFFDELFDDFQMGRLKIPNPLKDAIA